MCRPRRGQGTAPRGVSLIGCLSGNRCGCCRGLASPAPQPCTQSGYRSRAGVCRARTGGRLVLDAQGIQRCKCTRDLEHTDGNVGRRTRQRRESTHSVSASQPESGPARAQAGLRGLGGFLRTGVGSFSRARGRPLRRVRLAALRVKTQK